MKHEEKLFEQELARISPLFSCLYVKIPDLIATKLQGRIPPAFKRPFDAILVTPERNFCIEAKYQYGQLLDHQKITQKNINKVNSSYYVLRKKLMQKKTKTIYTVEQAHKVLFTTEKIEQLFEFFQQPNEHVSQSLMIDQLIPQNPMRRQRRRRVLL